MPFGWLVASTWGELRGPRGIKERWGIQVRLNRKALFTDYKQKMRCQWCKNTHTAVLLFGFTAFLTWLALAWGLRPILLQLHQCDGWPAPFLTRPMDGPGLGHVRGSQPHRPIYQCCEVEGRTQELVAGGTLQWPPRWSKRLCWFTFGTRTFFDGNAYLWQRSWPWLHRLPGALGLPSSGVFTMARLPSYQHVSSWPTQRRITATSTASRDVRRLSIPCQADRSCSRLLYMIHIGPSRRPALLECFQRWETFHLEQAPAGTNTLFAEIERAKHVIESSHCARSASPCTGPLPPTSTMQARRPNPCSSLTVHLTPAHRNWPLIWQRRRPILPIPLRVPQLRGEQAAEQLTSRRSATS